MIFEKIYKKSPEPSHRRLDTECQAGTLSQYLLFPSPILGCQPWTGVQNKAPSQTLTITSNELCSLPELLPQCSSSDTFSSPVWNRSKLTLLTIFPNLLLKCQLSFKALTPKTKKIYFDSLCVSAATTQ